ncbi:Sec1-like protein [Suhomyces tanzawaensis NRRL Y-17324]|uniref:Sec1-like protein n=1 Tax=Suhomyces tanzawaensis NRRL Y-17324 TaxID=984487 RepID=A0A1E4SJP0_9ASCO|nr:Sec1-like protein [Suhomyces tanzawaensis NRRL Y-17324]ODV79719.1 Sec1-like protein [Suhomyces tanzawaensis NRRL Y-17324]
MSKNKDPASLLNLQREYILAQIKEVQRPGTLYNLIIDDKTEPVIYRVLTKESLLRVVTSIEKIDANRKQNTFMEAIYLIDLTVYNMKCIVADVQTNRYKGGQGLFLPIPDHGEIAHFYGSPNFINNPKVLGYFEGGAKIRYINSNFYPVETRVFLTDNKTPNSMPIYYNTNCSDFVIPQVKLAAKSLVNLMIITGEYPLIRFYSPKNAIHQASRLPELIADEFQRQIDDYARLNHDYPPPSIQDKPRSILLISDRTLDLYAPLLHEFSYQALAMDVVESLERTGTYKYSTENERGEVQRNESNLDNEDDEDWVNLRHLHIIEASEVIMNKISDLIKNNPLMVDRSKASTSSDLMYVVAHLKGFDEERKQITLHRTLIDECLDINSSRKLAEFAADFEQTCAAKGTSFEGERNKHLHDDLITLLARTDLHVNDKMRLVLIYGLYRGGLIEADFVKLVKFIGVNDRQIISLISRCFTNLHKLGFPIVRKDVKDKRSEKEMFHTITNEGTYNTSRFGPGIKRALQGASKYQLDEEEFPYFRDKPLEDDVPTSGSSTPTQPNTSLRNSRIKASWAQSSTRINLSLSSLMRPKQRIFCYVAGGITYSEIRSIYELSQATNKDFYIGSESILKPRDFLIGLQSIDDIKTPDDLDLNILKEFRRPRDPPNYLFESGQPKMPQQPAMGVPNLGPGPVSSTVPAHYQKRSNTIPTEAPLSPEKEKKRSKLKKLFR